MTVRALIAAALVVTSLNVSAQAPTPVAERITTHLGRTTRVSLFSNHVVVVSIRSAAEHYTHRATLDYDEYMIYLQALKLAAETTSAEPVGSSVSSRDSVTVLTLYVGPDAPVVFRYSPLSTLNLSVAKMASVMDDLEDRALSALPGEYEIQHWQPEIGQCVELRQGGEACVSTIAEGGTIVLVREDIMMTYTVTKENRASVILKVIEPSP